MRTRASLKRELLAWKRTAKHYEELVDALREDVNRMTPEYMQAPYCLTHGRIASRQQVKGGAYVYMEWCGYRNRVVCNVEPKVGR